MFERYVGLFAASSLLIQSGLVLAQEAPVAGRAPGPLADGPNVTCSTAALQPFAPRDATVTSAVREGEGTCRVNGYVTTRDPGPNRVNFVLQLPDRFNGRYLFQGVGGAAGTLPVFKPALLAKGYAMAGTDAGTGASSGADFSFKSNSAKLMDFQWRAVKVSAEATQAIARGYYGRPKLHRYINGCSGGGAMAQGNAIRFGREDFDGFIAAATPWPGAAAKPNFYRIVAHLQNHPEGWLSPELLRKADAAILARYDASDGALDGIIHDTRNVRDFDYGILRKVGFTEPQIETFRMIVTPHKFSGAGIYGDGLQGGWPISNVAVWTRFFTGTTPPPWPNTTQNTPAELQAMGVPFYHVMADTNIRAQEPGLDYAGITDEAKLVDIATLGGTELATTTLDMSKIANSGAKMIIWQGSSDEAASYLDNLKGYEAVVAKTPNAPSWLRMFVVPGLQHCRGGNGPTEVEEPMIEALATWVETGKAPDEVLAPRSTPDRGVTRVFLLCAEPRRAVLKAPRLDFNKAENWECRAPA